MAGDAASCIFCCRMCGCQLFSDRDVTHGKSNGQTKDGVAACTSIFVTEAPAWFWTPENSSENAGKIVCPTAKCAKKLGHWSWSGLQCSCTAWIAPAFQFVRSHVDAKPSDPVTPVTNARGVGPTSTTGF
ncbi:putative dual specificity protein phosphatase [Porphyridium purpureum]|uniref:Putative dual specificity protein phosphatase n=1 Tax=Porphyridium purpureum TaxID=35688 RepID=A0A5J4Z6K2_PORPP|nr:putative dual specificity protein phosphatase [Porphyridium purpureum]|eukprot:POR6341..scf295_1